MAERVFSTNHNVVCSGCGDYIVLPAMDRKDSEIDAGLCIEITGWYGGFIDNLPGDEYQWHLCRSCATKLVRQAPFISEWLCLPMCPQCKRSMESCSFQSGICETCEWDNNPEMIEPEVEDHHCSFVKSGIKRWYCETHGITMANCAFQPVTCYRG